MINVKVFAEQNDQLNAHNSLHSSCLLIWIKKKKKNHAIPSPSSITNTLIPVHTDRFIAEEVVHIGKDLNHGLLEDAA